MIIESIEKRKNSPGRLIACYECGEALIMMGRKTADYKIAVYCRCGGVEYREKGIRLEENGGIALKEGDAYICPQCHEVFKPKFKAAFFAYHTPTTRKLTCPKCGHKGHCVETYSE